MGGLKATYQTLPRIVRLSLGPFTSEEYEDLYNEWKRIKVDGAPQRGLFYMFDLKAT